MLRAFLGIAAAISLAALTTGCGGGDGKLHIYKVSGRLTMDGKSFGPTVISLLPNSTDKKNPGRSVRGDVDSDGEISLTSYAVGDGAPAGEYRVIVGQTFDPPPKPFPAIYRDPDKTTLVVKIAPQEEENILEIDMDSKAGPMGKPPSPASKAMEKAMESPDFKAGAE